MANPKTFSLFRSIIYSPLLLTALYFFIHLLKELKNNSSFYVSQYVRIEHERVVAYVKNNRFILKLQTFKPRRQ